MASAALALRYAQGGFGRAPHALRLHTMPQRLLLEGRERLGQVEHFDHQPLDLGVFGGEGIHVREILRSFFQVRRPLTLGPRKGKILRGCQGPGRINDLRCLRKEGEPQALKSPCPSPSLRQ